jgi:hypothetical protein
MSCGNESIETLFTKLSSEKTGITFINVNIETEQNNILTYEYFYNGGGVAIGDINNDGLADIYFTSNSGPNNLYLNKGNLEFEDVTERSGASCERGWKTGVCMADVNGDGWLDIYVSRSGHSDNELRRNILLINNGDLTFTNKAREYGLDDDSYSTQAAFFDYDHDGDLDALLLNHSLLSISNSFDISTRNSKKRYPHVGNKLLQNNNGKFIDVSNSLGIYGPSSNYGLGVSLSDVNNDSWLDIYTGSDYTGRDKLLLNQRGGFFNDETENRLSHISKFTMGSDIADINNDGLMDIYTLDMLPEGNQRQKQLLGSDRFDMFSAMVKNGLHHQYMRNMLHLNHTSGSFSEIGQLAGISNTDWSWGALIADYDNDCIQDLFVSNGFKRDLTDGDFARFKAFEEIMLARNQGRQIKTLDVINKFKENKLTNYVFKGKGDLTFTNATTHWGLEEPTLTNGVAYADLDNDGDLDLIMNNLNDKAGIYKNNSEILNKNHFLSIQLQGIDRNSSAIGSKISVYSGTSMLVRELLPVRGFQSSVDHTLHFGLGTLVKIDSIKIQWPKGEVQVVRNILVDQKLTIKQDDSSCSKEQMVAPSTLFSKINPINFVHDENAFIDFNTQPLLPQMYSTQGPALAIADVNNDGLQDVFVGGAKDQTSALFIQLKDGKYQIKKQSVFELNKGSEINDAGFFDMDQDGDQDLYALSGGYEFFENDQLLQDKLYENDGKGNFILKQLPDFAVSGSCVRPADVDRNGDLDLFVGGRIVPGKYPLSPTSYILKNDGKGIFSLAEDISKVFMDLGMVTDARWVDVNKDESPDLVVVGEWMPIKIFINQKGKLLDHSSVYIKEKSEGLWNCIIENDFDKDGDTDFVIGNYGLNSQMKASNSAPVTLVFDDFDNNGSVDPLLNYFVFDKVYPYASRDELTEQLPSFKKKFTTYRAYANATIDEVLTPEQLKSSQRLEAFNLQTCYMQNNDSAFELMPLPLPFQFAPIFSMLAVDVNQDGDTDVITGGNLSATRARTGKLTGNYGFVGYGDGRGNFKFADPSKTGLNIKGDVRHMIWDAGKLLVAVNNDSLKVYQHQHSNLKRNK